MPPLYFHGNYNGYKEHNNTIWQSKFSATKLFFNIVTTISSAFSPAMESGCMPRSQNSAPAEVTHCCHCWNAPPTASLCLYPLVGLHKHSTRVDECQWVHFFFPAWLRLIFKCPHKLGLLNLSLCPKLPVYHLPLAQGFIWVSFSCLDELSSRIFPFRLGFLGFIMKFTSWSFALGWCQCCCGGV